MADEVTFFCGNNTKIVNNQKDGSFRVGLPCYCNVLHVDYNNIAASCDSALTIESISLPADIQSSIASSASASILPRSNYRPWQRPRKLSFNYEQAAIMEELDSIKALTISYLITIIGFFLTPLIILFIYFCISRNGAYMVTIYRNIRNSYGMEVHVGPQSLYPELQSITLEEAYGQITILGITLAILIMLTILCCVLRR